MEDPKSNLYPKITNHIHEIVKKLKQLNDCHRDPCNPEVEPVLSPIPIIGTVKLHGTHADIVVSQSPSNIVVFQSRNNPKLLPTADNHAFATTMSPKTPTILKLRDEYIARWRDLNPTETLDETVPITIAGEWIGPKVQKGVAVSELSNRFVIISVKINGSWVRDSDYAEIEAPDDDIYNISRGGFYHSTLHPQDPQKFVPDMQDLAEKIAANCPFAASFGVNGEGEGLVWKLAPDEYVGDASLWFKTKGGRFKPTFTPAPRKPAANMAEKEEQAQTLAMAWCNELRLEQGWDYLREMGATRVPETSPHTNVEYESVPRDWDDIDTSYNAGTTEPQHPKSWWGRRKLWFQRRFSGWRGGVIACISATSLVLFINIILAIVAGTAGHPTDGFATVYNGSCEKTPALFEGLQFIVNLFSTVLLGASNYCMQRLVAPTRAEIDAAHAKRKWLDIGMPSFRNLTSINGLRVGLWSLLLLSSLPLHFLFNSVIIKEKAAYDVNFLVVDPSIFTTSAADVTWPDTWGQGQRSEFDVMLSIGNYQDASVWDNITNDECVARYGAAYVTSGHGFGVPNQQYRNEYSMDASLQVLFSVSGSGDLAVNQRENYWNERVPFDYCLSQKVPGHCGIQFSTTIMAVVIVCNIFKLAVMVVILWKFDRDTTIVTIGDAVQSFIQTPDPTTKDCCLESRRSIVKAWKTPLQSRRGQVSQKPKLFSRLWFTAASWKRWTIPVILWIPSTAVGIWLATKNEVHCENYVQTSKRCSLNGFGEVSPYYLLDVPSLRNTSSTLPYVIVANTPQVIISLFYYTYNSLYTSMLANREWTQYATKRAALRVSYPKPGQRSTHFLQVPYVYSVPLLAMSLLFHWFVSTSIFLARVVRYEADDPMGAKQTRKQYQDSGLGYSMEGLVASLVWGSVLIGVCFLAGMLGRYPDAGMPLGGTNSAVVSAACHVESAAGEKSDVEGVVTRPLKWGVTREGERDAAGHCSFSDAEVVKPTPGFLYARVK
ncbi:hypothetical protein K491DRAFT_720511 [Lophiostoma macrostomum CBS 122681]|uniref:DUF6536 domain-containing protein n=1 Tax=Lophiostoma macrostomum CBS 122681 TaxID=1314788 RepID=A0A6A6SX00_9PLEO|nr:hypothetical protein K491DRAFT_720511 [Lophiostoma macrostomum CBS 122681]